MNSLWPSRAAQDNTGPGANQAGQDRRRAEMVSLVEDNSENGNTVTSRGLPSRPQLQRNQQSNPPPAVPPPPAQPAPSPPNGDFPPGAGPQPTDSLSLAQLRRIVAEFPRAEQIAYDYVYEDTGPIEEEIDEWFSYSFFQWVRLNAAHRNFDALRHEVTGLANDDDNVSYEKLVREALRRVASYADVAVRNEALSALVYLALGQWAETAVTAELPSPLETKVRSVATEAQLEAMKDAAQLLARCGGVPVIWEAMRAAFEPFWRDEIQQASSQQLQGLIDELLNPMTIMYMLVQHGLSDGNALAPVREELLALNPSLVEFMLHATVKLRWDETGVLPQTQVFLLFWKSLLLVFGGVEELKVAKKAVNEAAVENKEKNLIIASPLDYNAFRQEITSKYPAYIPPQCAIPLEAEQTSLLPQVPSHPSRSNGQNGILSGPPNQSGGASILNQPVHIATPAPSPPPSPAAGGKGGRKQNYQTNQNFPFMYPPLDATSNSAGGKGVAGLQYQLVGRKWEGSDVPASILEAGRLFSERVRMSRATRQLWDEREKFLRFQRGWEEESDIELISELDLSTLTIEERQELGLEAPTAESTKSDTPQSKIDLGPRSATVDEGTKMRLEAVETFYNESLPHLQSLVIVLLKTIIAIASTLAVPGANGQQHPQAPGQNGARVNGAPGMVRGQAVNGMNGVAKADIASPLDVEADEVRSREIAAKGVTGIIMLLLKWFKLSHVLKFEYLTQLLLDANYLPLVLKLFALQDVQQVVESKTDRIESSFFYFSGSRAGAVMPNPTSTDIDDGDESEDDAAPPPIRRRRSPQQPQQQPPPPLQGTEPESAGETAEGPVRPEVDELGYPLNPLPKEPITDFSRRNFFSLINYLRIMQKICKNKAHRNLLLVHYKSSNILRKSLKVPQEELRLYTLKLFKNQVPYCGRKWRQSNMRVITAVYLHCRPELRDEWLAGCDVEVAVDESLPLEQALRSLTHWFNVHRYPNKMAPEVREALREEHDFFVRELEKLELTWAEGEGDDRSMNLEWDQEGPWP